MMLFVQEFEGPAAKASEDIIPNAVMELNAELDRFSKDVIPFHIMFVETILVFALSAMRKADSDARLKTRNAKLIEAQLLRVRQSKHSMDRETQQD